MDRRVRQVVPVERAGPYTRDFDIRFAALADPRAVVGISQPHRQRDRVSDVTEVTAG